MQYTDQYQRIYSIIESISADTFDFGMEGLEMFPVTTIQETMTHIMENHEEVNKDKEIDLRNIIIFARDTLLGDPLFVDIRDSNCSVLMENPVTLNWEAYIVSNSLRLFLRASKFLGFVSTQKHESLLLQPDSMTDSNKIAWIRAKLAQIDPNSSF